MLSTNELTLAILAVLVVLDIALLFMNGNAKQTKELVEEIEDTDKKRWAKFISWTDKTDKAVTQMRKRDEKLLRELHKHMSKTEERHGEILDKFSDLVESGKEVSKKLSTISSVTGECKNKSVEIKDSTLKILKEFKKFAPTAESLSNFVKKAENARKKNS